MEKAKEKKEEKAQEATDDLLTAYEKTCDKVSNSDEDDVPVKDNRRCAQDLNNQELQKSLMSRRDRKKRRPKDEASDDEDFKPGELFN